MSTRAKIEYKLAGAAGAAGAGSAPVATTTTRGGVEVGTFTGYLATWGVDTTNDRFERGAFAASLAEHRARGNRPIRMRFQHHPEGLIGSFPIAGAVEDERGLRVRGEVVLEGLGRQVFALLKAGVLSDLSIGFITEKSRQEAGVRVIERARVIEGSLVDEPANQAAQVLSSKTREQRAIAQMVADLRASRRELSPVRAIVEELEAATADLRNRRNT